MTALQDIFSFVIERSDIEILRIIVIGSSAGQLCSGMNIRRRRAFAVDKASVRVIDRKAVFTVPDIFQREFLFR